MDHDEALKALASEVPAERLAAARFLQFWAMPADVATLRVSLQKESVSWVRRALEGGLRRLGDEGQTFVDLEQFVQDDATYGADTAALARARVARTVVHELEPIIGVISYYASLEVPAYESSKTRVHIERIAALVRAIDMLSKVSTAPRMTSIDLVDVLSGVVESERLLFSEPIQLDGPSSLRVTTDSGLLQMIVANALRNACEAANAVQGVPSVVTVIYGVNDREFWVSVTDNGVGMPPGSSEQLFEMGRTTKDGHLGVVLTLASEAALALSGNIRLRSDGSGTRFELSVPLVRGDV